MRLIDADKLYPDCLTKYGRLAISQSQIANALTVEYTFEAAFQKTICDNKLYCPKRPQGKWIATQVLGISDITLTCSNCKDEFIGENDIDTWKSVYHYCPSCGAYMEGDNNEKA